MVGCVLLSACTGPYSAPGNVAAKESRAVSVKVERVAIENVPEIITATGELLAEERTTVSAKVPGRILKLHVDLGSRVQAGDTIAELEPEDYQFRVRQSEAAVEQTRARLGISQASSDDVVPQETAMVRQAEAALREARFIFQTTSRLAKDGVVSKIDFEKAQIRVQEAEARHQGALEEVQQLRAQLSERRAQLALVRQQLADCTIKAPFAGAITRRQSSPGEYLPVNAPVAELVRQHPLRLSLEVPERLAVKVRAGQRIDVRLEGANVTRTGRVVRMSPAFEAQNRSLIVEGEIPNADGSLRPGTFAQAVITVDPNARGIATPRGALLTFAGINRMFVVVNGELDERLVKVGRMLDDDHVEIVDGLKEGDSLVLNASDRMSKGQKAAVSR